MVFMAPEKSFLYPEYLPEREHDTTTFNARTYFLQKFEETDFPCIDMNRWFQQMKDTVKEAAESVDMPYVTVRWVGGTLTNVETVNRQIKKLKDLERRMASGELENRYSKLEVQRFQEEIDLLNERYGGIKEMTEQPAAIIVVDALEDKNAIKEANGLHIPVIAFTDTNVDPTNIDYVIPMNDDSIKAVKLGLNYFVEAIKEGKK